MYRFFRALRRSFESSSTQLRKGRIFLPKYLKNRRFTEHTFPQVAQKLARQLGIKLNEQVSNKFPKEYDIGWKRQIVDYVIGRPERPQYFLELESLNRAQLYLFLPHGGHKDESKLWYYWGTLCKRNEGYNGMPRYFIFLLILPDQPVGSMPLWDATHYYKLFSPLIRPIIQANPYVFYDKMIKTSARLFLQKERELIGMNGRWQKGRLIDYQSICELVILTCTSHRLIMSRGSDGFDSSKERVVSLRWK